LFYNRGKQNYTTSYTYLTNESRNVLSVGSISNALKSHQLNFNHKLNASWLVTLFGALDNNISTSENFDVFYQYTNKDNTIGSLENLNQQKYGASFAFSNNQNNAISGEFNFFENSFDGISSSPVGFQMLEGLQPGKNFTWSLLAQKKLTKFLDLNLNYFGRKTETSKTIHTGNVQLKAYF